MTPTLLNIASPETILIRVLVLAIPLLSIWMFYMVVKHRWINRVFLGRLLLGMSFSSLIAFLVLHATSPPTSVGEETKEYIVVGLMALTLVGFGGWVGVTCWVDDGKD